MESTQKKKFRVPHVYVLLFALVLIAYGATFIVPSGSFERVEDESTHRTVVLSDSFARVDKVYLSPMDLPLSIVEGLKKSSHIIFFVLIIGGAFQIITASGVFNAITFKIARKYGNRGRIVIPIFLVFFSILGFTMGASQEVMIFIPIGVAIAKAIGYDTITGVAMMQLGAMCGFTAGIFNPFNVGVAQGIAQVGIYSGAWLRVIILIVFLMVTSLYILRYAARVKNDPTKSLCYGAELEEDTPLDFTHEATLTGRHIVILILLLASLGLLIWGIKEQDWFINEMSAIFLTLGIVAGMIAGMNGDKIADEFVKGARALTFAAMIIGLATSISVILSKGMVMDTIIDSIFKGIQILPRPLQGVGILISQVLINFFIISGTGQAAVVMPILTPLGDLLDMTRQTTVLAFQLGDGPTNSFFPTSATLMAVLSVAKLRYEKWVKFVWPLMLILFTISAVFVYIADLIHYQ